MRPVPHTHPCPAMPTSPAHPHISAEVPTESSSDDAVIAIPQPSRGWKKRLLGAFGPPPGVATYPGSRPPSSRPTFVLPHTGTLARAPSFFLSLSLSIREVRPVAANCARGRTMGKTRGGSDSATVREGELYIERINNMAKRSKKPRTKSRKSTARRPTKGRRWCLENLVPKAARKKASAPSNDAGAAVKIEPGGCLGK